MKPISGPHLLPRKKFPFTMKMYRTDTDECVWARTITKPDRLVGLHVPAMAKIVGCPMYVIVEYADGTIERSEPD